VISGGQNCIMGISIVRLSIRLMAITVKYFAVLRERFGKSEDSLNFEDGITVADLWEKTMNGEDMPKDLMVAVNMEYTKSNTLLKDGDEVAFFPTVTGG